MANCAGLCIGTYISLGYGVFHSWWKNIQKWTANGCVEWDLFSSFWGDLYTEIHRGCTHPQLHQRQSGFIFLYSCCALCCLFIFLGHTLLLEWDALAVMVQFPFFKWPDLCNLFSYIYLPFLFCALRGMDTSLAAYYLSIIVTHHVLVPFSLSSFLRPYSQL